MSKLLSRKFIMALATGVLIILNDGLDMGLDSDTIMLVVGIVGGWIFVEGGTDIAKLRKEANYDYSGIEAERKSAGDVQTSGDSGSDKPAA